MIFPSFWVRQIVSTIAFDVEEQEQCSDWLQMRGVPIAFTSQKTSPEKRGFSLNMCHLFFKHYMLKNKYCWKEHQIDRNTMNHLFQDGFMEGWINHDKPMTSWDDLPTTIDYEGLLHPPKAIGDGLVQAMGSQWCCGLVGPGPVIFNQPKKHHPLADTVFFNQAWDFPNIQTRCFFFL